MDLQILYNNPTKKKREGVSMKRRKNNPRLVYKKGQGKLVKDYATGKEKLQKPKGPGIKFGKINWPSREQRDEYMTRFVAAASRIGEIRDPEKMKAEYKKVQKLQQAFETSLDKKRKRLEKEIDRMKDKGYEYDSSLTEAEAKKEIRKEQAAIKAGESELKRVKAEVDKILSKIDGKNVSKKKKKKVSKKARKKASKKKASKRKATKRKSKGYKRKRNPIASMEGIEIMDNPRRKKARKKASKKKASKKASKKKASKKKASKRKSSKRRGAKKIVKGILGDIFGSSKKKKKASKKKASKKKSSKRKGSKRKGSKRKSSKIKAIAQHPSVKKSKSKSKSKSRKSKKYKLKGNPNKEQFMVKFENVTQHTVAEATGLLSGGALIKIYDHHIKQKFITPALSPMLSKLGAGAPVVDSLIDVLAAALIGAGISRIPVKGADVVGKGIVGAAVVQLGIKTVASASTALGMPMSGIIAVPSMNGIIAVPQGMNGIIGVPQMGAFSADFQGMGAAGMTNADFGAYTTVGLNGGLGQSYMQDADYGSGSVIPTAPRNPESLGGYENVEYSDEGEEGDF